MRLSAPDFSQHPTSTWLPQGLGSHAGHDVAGSAMNLLRVQGVPECRETIRDELIPNAIRWYTGEIQKDSDEDEEAEEGEDAGSDELDDSDSEEGDDDCVS